MHFISTFGSTLHVSKLEILRTIELARFLHIVSLAIKTRDVAYNGTDLSLGMKERKSILGLEYSFDLPGD